MTLGERNQQTISALHPALQKRATGMLAALMVLNINVLITEGLRTFARQAELYALGRSQKSYVECRHAGVALPVGTCPQHLLGATVTNAKPGTSWHQYGVAIDCVPDTIDAGGREVLDWNVQHPDWKTMLNTGKAFDLAEGADWRTFPDNPHFQLKEIPLSPTLEVQNLYTKSGLTAVWKWVDAQIAAAMPGKKTT